MNHTRTSMPNRLLFLFLTSFTIGHLYTPALFSASSRDDASKSPYVYRYYGGGGFFGEEAERCDPTPPGWSTAHQEKPSSGGASAASLQERVLNWLENMNPEIRRALYYGNALQRDLHDRERHRINAHKREIADREKQAVKAEFGHCVNSFYKALIEKRVPEKLTLTAFISILSYSHTLHAGVNSKGF